MFCLVLLQRRHSDQLFLELIFFKNLKSVTAFNHIALYLRVSVCMQLEPRSAGNCLQHQFLHECFMSYTLILIHTVVTYVDVNLRISSSYIICSCSCLSHHTPVPVLSWNDSLHNSAEARTNHKFGRAIKFFHIQQ
jgi:hypothetical protein